MTPDEQVRYIENMAMYRHYSNIRFLMVPIFVTVTFGLSLEYGNLDHIHVETHERVVWVARRFLPLAGMAVALVFVRVENVLDRYIRKHRLAAAVSDAPLADLPDGAVWVNPAIKVIYAGAFLYWSVLFLMAVYYRL
ncbi:hypothetical protein [Roseitranquillus sediminis]|uniref:hypothetical protein n=1 Tax=Roseitranquillus sediminis TaxID=2809051 RepID=UPI001D0CA02D|nr:hypothetical protein [Roseitranquillus sediminis]MBM9593707.1 hypothetical protein [Roseitranquillus sediminis]